MIAAITPLACVGKTATFSVVAAGTEPLAFQWRKDGLDIPGATGDPVTRPHSPYFLQNSAYPSRPSPNGGSL